MISPLGAPLCEQGSKMVFLMIAWSNQSSQTHPTTDNLIGPIAQWQEHPPFKRSVLGSSPSRPISGNLERR